jgi:hypothetical protein
MGMPEAKLPIKMPFPVKKMDTSFLGLITRPHPTTSSFPFAFGLMAPFGHSKACLVPSILQYSKEMEKLYVPR